MYIPLPEQPDREILLRALLKKDVHSLSDEEITKLSSATHGYSGADLKALCSDAALGPLRDLGPRAMEVAAEDVPPITYTHFRRTLKGMNPSVREEDLEDYIKFDTVFGNKPGKDDDDDDSESTKSDTPAQQPGALVPAQGSAGVFDAAAQAAGPFSSPQADTMLNIIQAREHGRLAEESTRLAETALMSQWTQLLAGGNALSPDRQAGDGNDNGDDGDDDGGDRKLAPGEQPKM